MLCSAVFTRTWHLRGVFFSCSCILLLSLSCFSFQFRHLCSLCLLRAVLAVYDVSKTQAGWLWGGMATAVLREQGHSVSKICAERRIKAIRLGMDKCLENLWDILLTSICAAPLHGDGSEEEDVPASSFIPREVPLTHSLPACPSDF